MIATGVFQPTKRTLRETGHTQSHAESNCFGICENDYENIFYNDDQHVCGVRACACLCVLYMTPSHIRVAMIDENLFSSALRVYKPSAKHSKRRFVPRF